MRRRHKSGDSDDPSNDSSTYVDESFNVMFVPEETFFKGEWRGRGFA